jgi:hypothetical protein
MPVLRTSSIRRRCTTSRRSGASWRIIARSPSGGSADRRLQRAGPTGSNIEAKTTLEMARSRVLRPVKEASGNLSQIADIIRGRSQEFSVLSGDDELTLPVMALGGDGIISVISNATPKLMSELCDAMSGCDVAARSRDSSPTVGLDARRLHRIESDAG